MKLFVVLTALVSMSAFALTPAAPKKVSHDKEHHHVEDAADHEHDEAHHKDHDHKAHHPKHDEEVKLDKHTEKKQ